MWAPIIREIVNIQRKENTRRIFINKEKAEITMPVTIPISLPDGKSWHEIIDDFMNEQFKAEGSSDQKA